MSRCPQSDGLRAQVDGLFMLCLDQIAQIAIEEEG
jgi:hypothetical protein